MAVVVIMCPGGAARPAGRGVWAALPAPSLPGGLPGAQPHQAAPADTTLCPTPEGRLSAQVARYAKEG
ncbi:hypothetical protein HaLaN_32301 [Haematococcus lacustris]|uniref:Uncharacterized protein n=1 Tax=Haematococcus lacustris TaxID=44745 RepID=A0A6A0AJP8_HAELA|nr:hypothetical protein HaLaN_32301 [Haematococcus lacustris]